VWGDPLKKVILATNNQGKVKELESMLTDFEVEILSLKDFPELPEVEEDGKTFEENALKKAREICVQTACITIADDSGLEVDALDGQPGVYSARFAGELKSDAANNEKLLRLLKDVPEAERTARFRCVIAVVTPQGKERFFDGACEGVIGHAAKGAEGFGYDPLFIVPAYHKTFAELGLETKNKISHRGKAFEKTVEYLREILRT